MDKIISALLLCYLHLSLMLLIAGAIHHGTTGAGFCSRPPHFPHSIELIKTNFENSGGQIVGEHIWTAIPRTDGDVVRIANWAFRHHYKVRPMGAAHSWSPATITNGTNCQEDKVILLETTKHMTDMKITSGGKFKTDPAVEVGAGVTFERLLNYLEENGFGIDVCPDYGGLTVLGVMGTGAHGNPPFLLNDDPDTRISVTIGNLVLSFRAVVWSSSKREFVLKRFERSHLEAKAFLVCLGRTIITSLTLSIVLNYNLRIVSIVDIPGSKLFSNCKRKQTLSSFIVENSSLEAIWYPYSDGVWLKVTTLEESKPASSTLVSKPYPFSSGPSSPETVELQSELNKGNWSVYPEYEESFFSDTSKNLKSMSLLDLWGPSKNMLLSSPGSGTQFYASAHVIITRLSNTQNVVATFSKYYENLLKEYTDRSKYPAYYLDFKVNRLDLGYRNKFRGKEEPPSLSPAKEIAGQPELDTSISIQLVCPGDAPVIPEFLAEIERFLNTEIHEHGSAVVRPEWAKNFAHTERGAFTNKYFLHSVLPTRFPGNGKTGGWDWTISVLEKYDPHHTFTNGFTEEILSYK